MRYRQALLDKGLAAATVNLRLSALRSAVRLARLSGATEWDLIVPLVRRSEPPARETRGPAVEEVWRLVEAAGAELRDLVRRGIDCDDAPPRSNARRGRGPPSINEAI